MIETRRKDSSSLHELRTVIDAIILESIDHDPDHVFQALEAAVRRCKAKGRYSEGQIDAAAAQLRREFGLG